MRHLASAGGAFEPVRREIEWLGRRDEQETYERRLLALTSRPNVAVAPTLVVHSELDPVPDAFSAWLAETMPSARYELLEPSSHFAYASKTRVLLPVVTRFLAEHAG